MTTSPALENLKRLSTCTVANAIETLKVRLRNEGFTDPTIRAFSAPGVVVGHAVTVRIRCSAPPTGSDYLEHTQWWDYVQSVPAPRLVIVQDVDPKPGVGALVGEVHANILRALGCVGVATNGTVRDLPALQQLRFNAYASGLAVSHAYSHIVDMGSVVEIGGLKVESGSVLHGDVHGLLGIPSGMENEIAAAAERLLARETEILRLCEPDHFSIESLRTAIRAFRNAAP